MSRGFRRKIAGCVRSLTMNRTRRLLSRTWGLGIVATLFFAAGHLFADTGPIGAPFATYVKSSELFGFFHFVETKRENAPGGGKIISFQPSGKDFHALVMLRVTTDDQDAVRLLQLVVRRSFIDDKKTVIFAADLAKSYLSEVPVNTEDDPVAALAREINARAMTGSNTLVLSGQTVPAAVGAPSTAYEVYAGKEKETTLVNQAGTERVGLRNESVDGVAVVEITVLGAGR
jgi:hypothetical protein